MKKNKEQLKSIIELGQQIGLTKKELKHLQIQQSLLKPKTEGTDDEINDLRSSDSEL